jgi:hypothetical protein
MNEKYIKDGRLNSYIKNINIYSAQTLIKMELDIYLNLENNL